MRLKTFFVVLSTGILFLFSLLVFKTQERPSFQSLVHKQIHNLRNLKNNFKHADEKKLDADEKLLEMLGFTGTPRLYPRDLWTNTTLPVIVTALFRGEGRSGVRFAKNTAHTAPHHAALLYNVGLSLAESQDVTAHCNTSQCQLVSFDLSVFPPHIQDDPVRTIKALVIQDALNRAGGVLYLENKFRITNEIDALFEVRPIGSFVTKQPVTTLTHPNMMSYFKANVESFLFLPMVATDRLLLWNTLQVHQQVMLPWIQCVLTPECVRPIGAQSHGCRFNKKPRYRYSGCHAYDSSALNVVLGLAFRFDERNYTFPVPDSFFTLSSSLDNSTLS